LELISHFLGDVGEFNEACGEYTVLRWPGSSGDGGFELKISFLCVVGDGDGDFKEEVGEYNGRLLPLKDGDVKDGVTDEKLGAEGEWDKFDDGDTRG
jgi:hypothetical protein